MATWLDITDNTSDVADTDNRSSAIFFIKNENTPICLPPLVSVIPPVSSKMDTARRIVSAAASRVSSWLHRQDRPVQAQQRQVSETQGQIMEMSTADKLPRIDAKRVPRSQRLAKQTESFADSGMVFALLRAITCFKMPLVQSYVTRCLPAQDGADSTTGSQNVHAMEVEPPLRQKKNKSRRKAAVTFASGKRYLVAPFNPSCFNFFCYIFRTSRHC
jgi:hypothetical protein